ncbi:hypothetical protein [Piscinibacter gummiphilus]|uniref:DUF4328 domain-containing protein n=1 Tax=Piscinibacter gummiphilus TaxID=946333 RepID=A0ABZ0D0W7_9BURK|nr:hypothetical protein [Piscinibacter gummiphilus]WOB10790.1 hypothetical protein RXV79_12205 [Piscinibacter gummiphilus]
MTAAIWTVFAVLLSLWTGIVWFATALMRWSSQALESASVGAVDLPAWIDRAPAWLTAWIPPDELPLIVAHVQQVAQWIEASLPWAGAAVGWLTPMVWVGWFVVVLVMTVAAFLLHVIVRRSRAHIQPSSA